MNRFKNLKRESFSWKINKITTKSNSIMKSIGIKRWKKILMRLEKS